jgi:hypothetical protein
MTLAVKKWSWSEGLQASFGIGTYRKLTVLVKQVIYLQQIRYVLLRITHIAPIERRLARARCDSAVFRALAASTRRA